MESAVSTGIRVAFEGRDLLVVEKPPSLPTAPLSPHDPKDTLCARVFQLFPEVSRVAGWHPFEGGLLYRLDNATSGLVVFARSDSAFKRLLGLQNAGSVVKTYIAVCLHGPKEPGGRILFPIAHLKKPPRKMAAKGPAAGRRAVRGRWRPARTDFRLIWKERGLAGVEFTITKARRHQIRVHCAAAGFPIVGDGLYRGPKHQRLMLHAWKVEIEELSISVTSRPGPGFESPGPRDLVLN